MRFLHCPKKAWQEEFAIYRRTPEYMKINTGMDLAGFQRIYYVEWFHRLWGRLIFFAALLPLVYFLARRRIPTGFGWALAAVPVGVALNGALGWFMVASGLVDLPRVSPYRLTAHLGFAALIYGYVLWLALRLLWPQRNIQQGPQRLGWAVVILTFITLLAGGFVAGTRAGLSYNTWPLMGESFFPVGMWAQSPWWVNLFENVATVQFNHRLLAYALTVMICLWWWRAGKTMMSPLTARLHHLLLATMALQVGLGIGTLLMHVPVVLAAAHQGGALLPLHGCPGLRVLASAGTPLNRISRAAATPGRAGAQAHRVAMAGYRTSPASGRSRRRAERRAVSPFPPLRPRP